jgi:hypothetical protein
MASKLPPIEDVIGALKASNSYYRRYDTDLNTLEPGDLVLVDYLPKVVERTHGQDYISGFVLTPTNLRRVQQGMKPFSDYITSRGRNRTLRISTTVLSEAELHAYLTIVKFWAPDHPIVADLATTTPEEETIVTFKQVVTEDELLPDALRL